MVDDVQQFPAQPDDGSTIQPAPGPGSSPGAIEIEQRAVQIAKDILNERKRQMNIARTGKIFTEFTEVNDIVENQKHVITAGLWSNGSGSLITFFTSSANTDSQKTYYYDVMNLDNGVDGAEVQFSVAYGNRVGSGSYSGGGQLNDSPSRAVYSQYRNLLLQPGDVQFTTADNVSTDQIYIVNFQRAQLKETLDPGNWEMNLNELNGDLFANNVHTGSNVTAKGAGAIVQLIDDSGDTDQLTAVTTGTGLIYNVVSGTIADGIYLAGGTTVQYYGLMYAEAGMIILDADKLDDNLSFNTVTGSDIPGDNAYKLFTSISGSAAANPLLGFDARNSETITSTYYFVRSKNAEYNFSNNPTFVTGSVGQFKQATFTGDPKVYITTVGLYNDKQELLAVAKVSKALLKSFENEYVIKCKLDW